MTLTRYACLDCGNPYPETYAYRCPACGGIFSIPAGIRYEPDAVDIALPGIWRYRHSFGLPDCAPDLTLGEGNTPLVACRAFGQETWFKLEGSNPTGSYKDRLAAPLVSFLLGLGVKEAVEDSSGNAGAAFAAYAARGGMSARIFIPGSASGPKRAQIEQYGAQAVAVPGMRAEATEAAMRIVNDGAVYASHAYLPQGLAGIATLAYEIVAQLGVSPGAVLAPVGHGGLLLGVIFGFKALQAAGVIEALPLFIGVQAENCAPLCAASQRRPFDPKSTLAGGISVTEPVRGKELLKLAAEGVVRFVSISEEAISAGRSALARQGFFVEPTSAVVWDALRQLEDGLRAPVVAILTATGLKQP